MPEYNVKIESFDERLPVLSSLRRPKCLTISGNDQREHRFLVKGGEDQRQDQRIETLFELINDLLRADSRCYQRNLSLKTYQVRRRLFAHTIVGIGKGVVKTKILEPMPFGIFS